ncbi:MAG TPA: hypothetical protein VFV70_02835 [Hyphomonadaceae bacterium]|nr:hypothetical protein [Hyphomonadaceae bacterium]
MSGIDGPRTASFCQSFHDAEVKAREVLRARGLPDEAIERELDRSHRDDDDFWGLPWWEAASPADEAPK